MPKGKLRFIPLLLALALMGTTLLCSTSTFADTDFSPPLFDIAYNGEDTYVAVGMHGTIKTSSDLDAWTTRDSGTRRALIAVIWGNDEFVAVGYEGTILSSKDGVTWKNVSRIMTRSNLFDIAWNGSIYVICGDDGTILTSPNLKKWYPKLTNTNGLLHSVTCDEKKIVIARYDGTMLVSANGSTWHSINPGIESNFYTVTWLNQKFYALGTGLPIVSSNGIKWSKMSNVEFDNESSIASNGESYVMVGEYGMILYSDNGENWEVIDTPFSLTALSGLFWDGKQYIAVDESGVVVTSGNGLDWILHTTN